MGFEELNRRNSAGEEGEASGTARGVDSETPQGFGKIKNEKRLHGKRCRLVVCGVTERYISESGSGME